MAVILRSGGQVSEVARILAVNEVPTRTMVSGRSLREQSIVRDLVRLVDVVLGRTDLSSSIASDILLSPLCGLTIIQVRRMRQALRHDELAADGMRTGAQLLPLALLGEIPVDHITMSAAAKVTAVARLIAELRAQAEATIEELLWKIWSWSKLAKTWGAECRGSGVVADEANRNLDAVLALFTAAKRFVEREPHAPAAKFVSEILASDVPEDTLTALASSDSVLVCTPAAVIGEEFEVVVLASVQEGRWPNLRPRGSLLHAPLLDHTPVGGEVIDSRKQVLDDELRMFNLAVTRARRHVILSATSGNEDAPSPFVRLAYGLEAVTVNNKHSAEEYPLSLRGMVGHMRRLLAAELAARPSGTEAAHEYARAIARLSQAHVPGANPETWYGLAAPSTLDKVALTESTDGRPAETVFVSPSSLEKWQKNQLGWFIDSTVSFQGSSATGIGTLIHEVFEKSFHEPEMSLDPSDMWKQIAPRWAELGIEPAWLSEREQLRAKDMLEALSGYLTDARAARREPVGVEVKFTLPLGEHGALKGSIDRIEKTSDGLFEIIDLKTGKSMVGPKDAPKHIQLACYQFAARAGALTHLGDQPALGGAKLLFLVNTTVQPEKYTLREQGPLPSEGNSEVTGIRSIEEMASMLEKAVSEMGGGSYTAIVYSREEIGQYDSRWSKRIHVIQGVSA
jgi:RecB family exonuclease